MFSKQRSRRGLQSGQSVQGAGGAFLERAVLEGFWEGVAFRLGLDGEKPLSAKTSGRSVPVGCNPEGKSLEAGTRVTHLESNRSFWLDYSFYFKGRWALWTGFHWEPYDLCRAF